MYIYEMYLYAIYKYHGMTRYGYIDRVLTYRNAILTLFDLIHLIDICFYYLGYLNVFFCQRYKYFFCPNYSDISNLGGE